MVFPRPEAEDFRAIALAPYAPLSATFLVAVPMGWLSRLRGLVVKAAQTWPAGNEVSYRVSNEWMLASWPYDAAARVNGTRSMAESGVQRKRSSSGLEGRPFEQFNAYICVCACLMCETKGKVFLATPLSRPFWRAYPRAFSKKEPWGR